MWHICVLGLSHSGCCVECCVWCGVVGVWVCVWPEAHATYLSWLFSTSYVSAGAEFFLLVLGLPVLTILTSQLALGTHISSLLFLVLQAATMPVWVFWVLGTRTPRSKSFIPWAVSASTLQSVSFRKHVVSMCSYLSTEVWSQPNVFFLRVVFIWFSRCWRILYFKKNSCNLIKLLGFVSVFFCVTSLVTKVVVLFLTSEVFSYIILQGVSVPWWGQDTLHKPCWFLVDILLKLLLVYT